MAMYLHLSDAPSEIERGFFSCPEKALLILPKSFYKTHLIYDAFYFANLPRDSDSISNFEENLPAIEILSSWR